MAHIAYTTMALQHAPDKYRHGGNPEYSRIASWKKNSNNNVYLLTVTQIIFAFFAYCCNKMVNRLQDTDNLIISSINLEKIGFLPFEKTKFKLFA